MVTNKIDNPILNEVVPEELEEREALHIRIESSYHVHVFWPACWSLRMAGIGKCRSLCGNAMN